MSRLPHFLDNRLTDGVEVVSLTRQLPFTLRKIPGTHFCYMMSQPQGHSAAGRARSTEIPMILGIEPATFQPVAQ
jgi:hypothetical protein